MNDYFSSQLNLEVLSPTRNELNLLNHEDCEEYLKKNKPEIVIHAAVDIESVENSLKVFFNIFNNKHHFGRLIQIGSGAEYDKRKYTPKMDESKFGVSVPIDTYGMSKYLIAREMEVVGSSVGLNLRVFGIFGPRENYMRRFISNNICRILSGYPISINQDMYFDYIDVQDLGRFIVNKCVDSQFKEVSYNFCTGKPILLSHIASIIKGQMKSSLEVKIAKHGLNSEYSGSPNKIMRETGNFEFTPIENSIARLIDYYENSFNAQDINKFKATLGEK